MAWTGAFAEGRPEQVRLEAASWEGRPVFFDLTGDWQQQTGASTQVPALAWGAFAAFLFASLAVGAAMVRHNLRLGRGEIFGRLGRIAAVAFLAMMCTWAFGAAQLCQASGN